MDFRSLTPFGRREPARTEDPFMAMRREMERMFDEMGRRFGMPQPWGEGAEGFGLGSPKVDLNETEKTVELRAELPGVTEKEVELELADGVLTIKGEKKDEKKEEKEGWHMSECSYGSFMRRVPLPCEVDEDKVEARFDKGVLTVTMPKTPAAEARTRKIAIKGS